MIRQISGKSFIEHSADSCRLVDDGWRIVAAFHFFSALSTSPVE